MDFVDTQKRDSLILENGIELDFSTRSLGLEAQASEEYLYIGYIYFFENKEDSAQIYLKTGLKAVESKNDTLNFKYLALIAGLYDREYQLDSAQLYFKKGYNLLLDNPQLESSIPNEAISFYNNFTSFLNRNGETKLRKSILDKAYDLALGVKKKDYLGFIEYQLAKHYFKVGDLESQEKLLLLTISHTSKPFYRLSRYLSLARLYQDKNQWNNYERLLPKISSDLSKVLESSKEYSKHKLTYYFLYSRWLFHRNENIEAKILLVSQLELGNRLRTTIESEAYLLLAKHAQKEEKEQLINKAIASTLIDKNPESLSIQNVLFPQELILALKQKVLIDNMGIKETLTLIGQIQKAFPFEETKYTYQEEVRPFIGQLIQGHQKDAGAIFEYMEYGKAGILNQVVTDQEIKFGDVASGLLKKKKTLDRQLLNLRLKLAKDKKPSDSLVNKIDEVRIQQSFLQKEMEQESPSYYDLKYKDNVPQIKELQKSLKPHQAILNYFKDGETLYSVLLKKDRIKAKQVILQKDFNKLLSSFLKEIYTNPGFGAYGQSQTAQKLYTWLIGDLDRELNDVTELIILRDEELNQLPFEVLETNDGELLLDKYAISY